MDNRRNIGGPADLTQTAGRTRQRVRTLVGVAYLTVLLTGCFGQPDTGDRAAAGAHAPSTQSSHVGMWVTADGYVRQELLADGRYDEARGDRESAYTGSYRVSGSQIDYVDDTGFTADGRFDGDILHHGGYVFFREGSQAHRRATESR
ncbi:Atu4866 domain-containing protein [Kribbella sp. CA-294648]|uniref:Atu4866 domain-containing protein n=1 Tax=Kribbella sp. CA-294648 TaxID=3239948 RepID=UPI003D91CDCB